MLHRLWLTRGGLTGLCGMSSLPAEAVALVSHQLQVSITNLTRWTFMPAPGTQLPAVARAAFTAQVFSLSGVYSLKDPCTRKSCAGQAVWVLGNGSCGLKEMTAWETRSPVTCSWVFHKQTCKIKKILKERSANKRAIEIKAIPNHDNLIYSAQDQKVPAHKVTCKYQSNGFIISFSPLFYT